MEAEVALTRGKGYSKQRQMQGTGMTYIDKGNADVNML